jgi:hypothetical protein
MIKAESPPPAIAVVGWLLQGADEIEIRHALATKFPTANADVVMLSVQQHLGAAGRPNTDAVRGWAILSYRNIYSKMLEAGDYDGCRKVIKEITQLCP